MAELHIVVRPGGRISYIYNDTLAGLLDAGPSFISRASQVEPSPDGWTADMALVGGPVLGPFFLRQDALAAEVQWIVQHFLTTQKGTLIDVNA